MEKHHWIFLYIISFVFLAILLKAFGIISIENAEILSYALICYGVSSVFLSFGASRRGRLFTGTIIFLVGIILFIRNHFAFIDDSAIILPSVFYILGISFLIIYIDELNHKVPLYAALIFIITGIILTYFGGSPGFITFVNAVPEIFIRALPFLVLAVLLIVLLP